MIKRGYILVGVFILIANILFAQSPSVVKAYELYTQGEYALASKTIDQAVKKVEGVNNPLAWQIRAYIYIDLFIKVENRSNVSESRVISLQSALRSMELDTDKELYNHNIILLDRLSGSYYNDAVVALKNLNPDNPTFAESSFKEFSRIQKIAHPDSSLDSKTIEFYRAQATSFGKLYQSDYEKYKAFFDMTLESLVIALEMDSLDYGANYNMAIYLFNEGVYIIEGMNVVIDIPEIVLIEKKGVELFKKAEPYMLRAHELRPREETLKGLKLIYRSLNDIDRYEYYSNELELFLENKIE